ncbi:MAG TPA: hypothetical protein VJM34_01805 [Novosphingobium sp.]|nr:hypothetical protein [Novosphingobium sp.]
MYYEVAVYNGPISIFIGVRVASADLERRHLIGYQSARNVLHLGCGLTQEEAGRLIGGGRRAFQKYENGAMPPTAANAFNSLIARADPCNVSPI